MAEDEISALKVALCNQLVTMKKLYMELEEEREASASGTNEALSMIIRLQKEKAEEKMEHCQYKKFAEAKIQHIEESLATLDQLLFDKELENASLKCQVQAYRQKLLSFGISNVDINNIAIYDSRIFIGKSSSVRRQISMPSILLSKLCSEMEIISEESSSSEVRVSEECGVSGLKESNGMQNLNISSGSTIGIKDLTVGSTSMDIQRPLILSKCASTVSTETEIQHLKCRMQRVEDDICVLKQEDVTKGKKEFTLRSMTNGFIASMHSHITSFFSSKYSPQDEAMFDSLTEAMLSFSI